MDKLCFMCEQNYAVGGSNLCQPCRDKSDPIQRFEKGGGFADMPSPMDSNWDGDIESGDSGGGGGSGSGGSGGGSGYGGGGAHG